jgi:transposase
MSGLSVAAYFPWCRVKVTAQNTDARPPSALVRIEPDQRYRPTCHECGQPARAVHSSSRRFIRDLNFADCAMMLQVEYRKVWCDHCGGVRVEHLEFADTSQRLTHRLAAYAAELCRRGLSVAAVAEHLDLDPKTVKAIDKAALQAEFGETRYDGLRRLAIDEIALKKGQNDYMTVVLDYDTGRVVWMGLGHGAATLDHFFGEMPGEARAGIQAVAIDMWDPYIKAIKRWCPQADIVFDLFHVVRAFSQVIDDIRNEEFRNADRKGQSTLRGSKYLFLKNWGNLGGEQQIRLKEILALNQRLSTIYWLKDLLRHIWDYQRPAWAAKVLEQWCAVAREDGHPKLRIFAGRLEGYRHGILNHCRHPMHTSRIEGVNNKIKVIKRVAYGFHDPEYFALKVKQAFPGRAEDN